jgi:hypothetical protein
MAKTSEPEAGHDDHDHDHDHDHDGGEEHELDEAERAQAEADVARMSDALAALDDDALRHGLGSMSEKSRAELASQLQLPRATMHLGDALVPLVRRKLRNTSADHQLQATFAIVERVNDTTVAALGDRSEDPSREDLLEVLPAVIDEHGSALVTAMMAGYAASDAECRPAMRDLLETDERFAIGPPVEIEERADIATPGKVVDEKALAVKREQRKAAKDAKRAAELREREARTAAQAKRREAVHNAKRKDK